MNVCNTKGVCVPVKFNLSLEGVRVDIDSDDVNELVAEIHRADDTLQEDEE
jgi:hypothetical protein